MQTVKYRYYYPIRRSLIPIIKSNRLQFFKKIVGNDEDETNFELSRKEFVIISTLFQTNIDHLLIYISLVFRYGGVFITVFHAFLQVCVGMPVYCLLTFMSSYTKSSFLKFFECIPILQGIGYTIGLLRFGTEIRNVMIASLSMIAIADILLHDKHVERIRQCMIGKHVQKSCLVMYPQKNHTMECPRGAKRKDIFFSTQFYFRSQVLQYNSTNLVCCKINGKLFGVSLCIWTLICCLSVFGMERIKKATVNIQIVFGCLLLSIAIYIVSFSNEDIQSVDAGTQIVFDRFEVN
ncbi:hypothetical protein QE152_g27051 [Popillia japonica]|uniref:Uncharacterized protein n=1 Tax=Popillia japonica TaxID=7064 RepID=A0AAW1JXF4_POPJA